MLVFRSGDPGDWAVPLGAGEDPPVLLRLGRPGEWTPVADHVFSEVCIELALSESVRATGPLCDNRSLDDDATTDPDGPPVRWFGDDDTILRTDGRARLWVRGVSQRGLDNVRGTIRGGWAASA
jgi:hypothetical protein